MKTFGSYLLNEEKNTHMSHLEDSVIYGGVDGARQAILALRSLRDMLAGNSKGQTDVTVKWDGAPAVFAGIDPTDGKFFVAKKGIFNKNPKVYKSHDDIDDDIDNSDLANKMKIAYTELKKLGIKGVIQGDIMFTNDDLKKETIEGEEYVTFHPNTIVYAVPANSKEGKYINSSPIGVVFHTSYSGSSFDTMKANYGVDVSNLRKTKAWIQSAELRDLSGTATMTKKETDEVTEALSIAGKIFRKIAATTLKQLEQNSQLTKLIETYNNSFVRKGERIRNTSAHVDGLIKFIRDRYQKDIDKLKTEKGKINKASQRDELLSFFSVSNKVNLKYIFDLQEAIVNAKLILLKKLNSMSATKTFVKTTDGFKVTGAEGFVAIDHLKGGAVKLVDRLEFSYNNFSPEILKGWDSPTR